ncbi:MAG TPA: DUF4912 domain-containing protein [Desulfobacteria bacterium]|nr:DUF4912 domain-containing protein [Desulfobacteria bacterium]
MQNFVSSEALNDETWTRTWQTNRIVLLVKEPTTLFCYWEVNDLLKDLISRHFQTDWHKLRLSVQLYDVTWIIFDGTNANSIRRISVDSLTDNWYIHEVAPGRNYIADFGVITASGQFFTIVRSNTVASPPLAPDYLSETARFGKIEHYSLNEVSDSKPIKKASKRHITRRTASPGLAQRKRLTGQFGENGGNGQPGGKDSTDLLAKSDRTELVETGEGQKDNQETWQKNFDGYSLIQREGEP